MSRPDEELLSIESLAAGGRGVARHEGLVWFVAGALPGDRVRARVLKRRERFVEARAVERLEEAPERRGVPCAIQERCGGCPWMALPLELQRGHKARLLRDALARIARLDDPPIAPIRGAGGEYRYRDRVELQVEAGRIGFRGPDGLVDVARCELFDPDAEPILAALRPALRPRAQGRVLLRRGRQDELLLAWDDGLVPRAGEAALARRLEAAIPRLAHVVRWQRPSGARGGSHVEALLGSGKLRETIGGRDVELPATTFTQVNHAVAIEMRSAIVEALRLDRGQHLWELYGGVGAVGMQVEALGVTTLVCEADAQAVAAGRQAAPQLVFEPRRVERFLAAPTGPRADRILANPPRAGMGREVVEALIAQRVARQVWVSCDPATLARDLKFALAGGAYRLESVIPFDMFPQTAHVEAVVTLVRDSGDGAPGDGGEE